MESDCVVFIDGSLIEDGALERRRPRRRRQLSPAMGTSPLQRKIALESGAHTAQRREASCGRFKFVEALVPRACRQAVGTTASTTNGTQGPAPRLRRLGL